MANLVLALLTFALVTSVGASVALHQVGSQTPIAPHNGDACAHDQNETNEENETAEHAWTPGQGEIQEHNETGDHDNETAEHDDNGACEPNAGGEHHEMGDSDSDEARDED